MLKSFALKLRMPRNNQMYFHYLTNFVLERCKEFKADCVVEVVEGKMLLFTDYSEPGKLLLGAKGFLSINPVSIFNDEESVVSAILPHLSGCSSFALRSNKKAVEREIGGTLAELSKVPVDLESPECEFRVEKRGKFYLLFLDYPKHG